MIKGFERKAPLTKACPYCGSKKVVMTMPEVFKKESLRAMVISCDDCGAMMHGFSQEVGDYNTAYRDALKRWNHRRAS